MILLLLWELNEIRLRGFFLEPTVPDLGNSSGGNIFINFPSPHCEGFILEDIMNKSSQTIRTICEIGIFAALGYVIDELQGILSKGIFVNGGSIGFAMIAVLIIAYRRGWLPAILTGFIMGALDVATSAYILHPVQLILDYILPYAIVGLVGFLKPEFDKYADKKERILWLISGAIIGGLLKCLSHYLAGIFFWADPDNFAWGLNNINPYLYCFIYNIAFIGPSIILTGGLLVAIYIRAPRILVNVTPKEIEPQEQKADLFSWILNGLITFGGAFCFTFFLIKYINSFGSYQDGPAFGYDFDQDSMLIFVLGFSMMILGIISLICIAKRIYKEKVTLGILITIFAESLIYGLARLIRSYMKGKDPTTYWIWLMIGVISLIIAIFLLAFRVYRNKKMGD